jgi:hypothetical protein
MSHIKLPQPEDGTRNRSSLKHGPVLPAVQASLRPSQREWEKLARDHSRQRAKLVTAAERRAARKQSEDARTAWQKTSLLARLDADQRATAKSKARRQLERRLGQTIRRYRELAQLERNYVRETGRAARDLFKRGPRAGAHINWGPIVWAEPFVEATSFTAPFPHHVLESGDLHGLLVADNSFVLPDVGQLIQNFTFAHNESSWLLTSNVNFVDHLTSCGVDYTLPAGGRLQVSAEIENFANRLTCSIRDNFGISRSFLTMTADLFIGIVRPGQPMDYYPNRVLASYLSTQGDDVDRSFSDLDNAVPFGVGAVSTFPIPEGETVTVLAGAHVRIDSDTDDMDAHVQATFWWRLQKLTVGVI